MNTIFDHTEVAIETIMDEDGTVHRRKMTAAEWKALPPLSGGTRVTIRVQMPRAWQPKRKRIRKKWKKLGWLL